MLPIRFATALLTLPLTLTCFGLTDDQSPADEAARQRIERHRSADWLLVEPHLPDPTTASPDALTVAADVLRARRMPEDALEYYQYALSRGGEPSSLNNRIGVTMLELHQAVLARVAFKRALQSKPKDAQTWNNLGASEYVAGNLHGAINDYLKAVKLDKKAAVYHANLGTAYFDVKNVEDARKQFALAIKLDPNVFQKGDWGGVEARVLSPTDRGQFCLEMARLAVKQHDEASVLRWLGKATEAGFDIRYTLATERDFEAYRKDPRVAVMLQNIRAMRPGQLAQAGSVPTLAAGR